MLNTAETPNNHALNLSCLWPSHALGSLFKSLSMTCLHPARHPCGILSAVLKAPRLLRARLQASCPLAWLLRRTAAL